MRGDWEGGGFCKWDDALAMRGGIGRCRGGDAWWAAGDVGGSGRGGSTDP